MLPFFSRFRKAGEQTSNPLDDSASMGEDPYLAQIVASLSRPEDEPEADAHQATSTIARDKASPQIS
ncbi:hypothetical protein LMG29542_02358 [Paraburkholderia humisilvae]|uniref:Uncharacterized protein n=1 Tax=Paraburkholderia humisilvae TaxID=627669 RepID=A0A6J5DJL5_9BURK|nr:hypothetical protein LMG29542_02358 [Paraburkholderia humisilvae]